MKLNAMAYNINQRNNNSITEFKGVLTKSCCSQPPISENVTCDALGSTLISVLCNDPNDEYDFRGFFNYNNKKPDKIPKVEK